ncbi:holin [Edaphobacillus lindanitolerans]|uniref:Bacteriophage A118-like holin, Hol118 n=1 Tax=Edaphobacillus lindanitolerans TaxID=550447 RepID=A0A1U7PN33_9BACI|nr:holin [Edaphobacillus lindanitolerans]SIT91778.1 Bacteriophage A118-like holin, Hol118 [Edaphobacillus lindanitolerans]
MTEVLIFATVLAPIILALVQLVKKTFNIPNNLISLIAFAVGIFVGAAAAPFTADLDLVLRLWAGGLAGLSATGLFELMDKQDGTSKGNDTPDGRVRE